MRPFARVACAVAFLGTGLYGASALSPNAPTGIHPSDAAVAMASLAIAAFALGIAAYVLLHTRRQTAEFTRFSRSADIALSRLSAQGQAQAETIAEMEEWLDRQSGHAGTDDFDGAQASQDRPKNVIQHPSATKAKKAGAALVRKRGETAEAALARAVSEESLELSLQPIISVAGNVAVGFETFAHVELEDGTGEDVSRLSASARDIDTASLERLMIVRASETARRRLGTKSGTMPLHCAISEALLDVPDASARVIELFSAYPALCNSIVLSVPTTLLFDETPARRQALADLLGTGVTFAAEDWEAAGDELPRLRDLGVVYLKLPASRLLDRDGSRHSKVLGLDIVTAASECGIKTIASGIENDEDAVNLLDLGIDLMVGNRFSEPKRLRSADQAAGRVA